jgi:3-hydroxyacyl-CoA dehydrogenase
MTVDIHTHFIPPELVAAARAGRALDRITVEPRDGLEWLVHPQGYRYPLAPEFFNADAKLEQMDALGIEVAGWVREMLAAGNERFYTTRDGGSLAFDPRSGGYQPVPEDPDVLDLARVRSTRGVVAGNSSASLVNLGDGVLCFELHSPASAIDRGAVEIGHAALAELDRGTWAGLVIANTARNFSVGANLGEIGMLAYQAAGTDGADPAGQLDRAVRALQELCTGLRFAPVPVVAAPHGQTLGGGLELCLAADRIVATAETYAGLVEVGVGVIPAGGGCKEMVRRVVSPPMAAAPGAEVLPFLERVFTTIGTAKVSGSALEARELGFLADHDTVVMHPDHQLATAKREVLALADGYQPPEAGGRVYAAGARALAALELGVQTLRWAGQASEHDAVIGRALARVLTGGELSTPQWVGEQHLLDLERAAFLELVTQPKSLERIQAMLTTGKPLRN